MVASVRSQEVDKAIDDEATRVEYAKMKLLQASQAGNAEEQVEYLREQSVIPFLVPLIVAGV